MRPSTKVWLGIKHIGHSTDPDQVLPADTVVNQIRVIADHMLKNQMTKRFVYVVARDEEGVRQQFSPYQSTRKEAKNAALLEELDEMWAELEAEGGFENGCEA